MLALGNGQMAMVTVMADVLHGFNYFFRFGTAARPDHALCAETRLFILLEPRATGQSYDPKSISSFLTLSIVPLCKERISIALYIGVFFYRTDQG